MITDRNSAAGLLQGQPSVQYTAKLQYNSKGTYVQHTMMCVCGGEEEGNLYT